jgi:serine/threonine protein phosphatase 1
MSAAMIEFIAAPTTLPQGQRVYAIGDIHGCIEQLAALHEAIAQDLAERPVADALLIHLGDYVDRGPDSAAVVDLLAAGPPLPGLRTVNLMGNHEHMMLDALASGQEDAAELWLSNGGADTLFSWGVPRLTKQADWAALIPAPHLVFLRDLELIHQEGPYLFVHAGIRPGVRLGQQAREDLLWIREPFLSAKGPLLGGTAGVPSAEQPAMVVVHGHTPKKAPVVRPNRIGIDTGAVMGGVLTCAVLEDDRVGFLTS